MQQTLSRASAPTVRRSLFLTTMLATAFAGTQAWAQTQPPANTVIGNQATATYTDSGNIQRTASSNTVQTTVLQVAAIDLTADNTKQAPPGSPVYFPHTVVNNGNGTDTITLSAADNPNTGGEDFDIGPLTIYADSDGNGLPDSTTPITSTGPLAPGQSFRFVVGGTVPNSQAAGDTATINVTATSGTFGGVSDTDTNTDTVQYSTNAVINLQKSVNVNRGPSPSGPYTYTLTYSNIGNAAATNVEIEDVIPAGMTYVDDSGRWSVTPTTTLTDLNADNQSGITYVVSGQTVTATIDSVAVGATGSVSFQVNVDSNVPPQTLNNIANLEYDDDPTGVTNIRTGTSNTVVFTVTPTAAVTLTPPAPVSSAPEGGVVPFNNTLTNNGTAADIFDITIAPGSPAFPTGSSYQLYQPDGFTPMLDSNGNGIPDTGLVAPGATYIVVLKVTLPGSVTSTTGPFRVVKTATSTNDPAVSDDAIDQLDNVTPASVDITNNTVNGLGAGAGPGNDIVTNTANPGETSRFTLVIENTSGVPDNYNLLVDTGLGALPAGFTVTFRNAAGGVITNTGTLAPGDGGAVTVYADVFVPANATPQDVELFFRATSPTTGATDVINDLLTVNEINQLSIEPNNTGQTYQGGAITYSHILANNGNTVLSNVALSSANSQPGFTSVIYRDLDGDGVLDPNEAAAGPLTSITTLNPGDTVAVLVRVFAPSGANPGQVDVTTVTATDGSLTDTATDTTTIVVGDVRVEKLQSINGGAFTAANGSARPGDNIRYRIIVTNTGAAPVTSVVVNDSTPAYTTFDASPAPTRAINGGAATTVTNGGGNTIPGDGSQGSIIVNVGTLNANDSATIEFSVDINPLQNP